MSNKGNSPLARQNQKPGLVLSLAAMAARWLPERLKNRLYYAGPLTGWIRAGLNQAAPRGMTIVTVAGGALAGMRLELDLQTEKDNWLGTYEPELQQALGELVQPGIVAYDVGANMGYITLLLARLTGESGQVYAFEALPDNLQRLQTNLALNDLSRRVTVTPGAVIDSAREVRFLVGPSGGMGKAEGSAGRKDVAYESAITVAGFSLDEFVFAQRNHPPQIVKMDIEGGEVLALPGMQSLLSETRPIVLLELHGPEAAQTAWSVLSQAGYRICQMQPGFPAVASIQELDWKAYLAAFPPEQEKPVRS